jgi:hypothetical protein
MYLKILIMFSTQMLKEDLNGSRSRRQKLILCRRITLGTCFPNYEEIKLLNVDGSTRTNLPLKVLLSDIKYA